MDSAETTHLYKEIKRCQEKINKNFAIIKAKLLLEFQNLYSGKAIRINNDHDIFVIDKVFDILYDDISEKFFAVASGKKIICNSPQYYVNYVIDYNAEWTFEISLDGKLSKDTVDDWYIEHIDEIEKSHKMAYSQNGKLIKRISDVCYIIDGRIVKGHICGFNYGTNHYEIIVDDDGGTGATLVFKNAAELFVND